MLMLLILDNKRSLILGIYLQIQNHNFWKIMIVNDLLEY